MNTYLQISIIIDLIIGDLDYRKFKDGIKSNKMIKSEKYITEESDTKISNENFENDKNRFYISYPTTKYSF